MWVGGSLIAQIWGFSLDKCNCRASRLGILAARFIWIVFRSRVRRLDFIMTDGHGYCPCPLDHRQSELGLGPEREGKGRYAVL